MPRASGFYGGRPQCCHQGRYRVDVEASCASSPLLLWWPTCILWRDGGLWGLSGVFHLLHGPLHLCLHLFHDPLRLFLHLPHHLIALPLSLQVVVIREHTYCLLDAPFDLVGFAPHRRSPFVSCGGHTCGHHGCLCDTMPRADAAVSCAAPIGLLSRHTGLYPGDAHACVKVWCAMQVRLAPAWPRRGAGPTVAGPRALPARAGPCQSRPLRSSTTRTIPSTPAAPEGP